MIKNNTINTKEILDKLLNAGKEYVSKGQSFAEEKLDIPAEGEKRDHMLDGLKKGAIASALLVGLLGTKGGRKLTGLALKVGGVAALGTAAFKGYQNWKKNQPESTIDTHPIHELDQEMAQERGLLIIQAMVSAANADGHIDGEELAKIKREIINQHLPDNLTTSLEDIVNKPLSAKALSEKVSSEEIACEVYIATRLLIDEESSVGEKLYLQALKQELGLADALVDELEKQII